MQKFGGDDIEKVITGGIVFKGASKKRPEDPKVKTKAKKRVILPAYTDRVQRK